MIPLLAAGAAAAAAGLDALTITATLLPRRSFDVPASAYVEPIAQTSPGLDLAESLRGVPGLLARQRQNYAQDSQLSIRGFGARATFGVRGIRIYLDGIPQSLPDGQGQLSQLDLVSADRVEVLSGPFSALYGNSSGGVMELHTAAGTGRPQVDADVVSGSFGTWRASADARGAIDRIGYSLGLSTFGTDGSRGHSGARRTTALGQTALRFGNGARLVLEGSAFCSSAQDPLGLTRAQFDANPRQSAPSAIQYDTRKRASQGEFGATLDQPLGSSDSVRLMGYVGGRGVLQYLALPVSVQLSPTSAGSVVDLAESFAGFEPRWTHRFGHGPRPLILIGGLTYDRLDERRRGFEGFSGNTLGVVGSLARDASVRDYALDEYLQLQWQASSRWNLVAGDRHSVIAFDTSDRYVRPGGISGTGNLAYASNSPAAGVSFAPDAGLMLYASYGAGFETPTDTELAYRPDGLPGINGALRAARSSSFELGTKARAATGAEATLALFDTRVTNELAVLTNAGGRATYTNIGRTRREGVEMSASARLTRALRWQLSYSYLDAYVDAAYLTCALSGCTQPNTLVAAGRRMAGISPHHLFGSVQWQPAADWRVALDGEYVAAVYANDANTVYAGSYGLIDLAAERTWSLPQGRLRAFLRLENLLDRRYAGSVIVNSSNAQYFEAGPGRAVYLGLTLRHP